MGRVQDNHSSNQTEGGTQRNDYPDVPDEMIPGFEKEEDQMSYFQGCEDPRSVTFQEVDGVRRKASEYKQIASPDELTDSVRE